MHEPLSHTDAETTKEMLRFNNGSLFSGQLAYHAWNAALWKDHLSRLDERVIVEEDTRFNLMVRQFLDYE
jgi:hypothetical protein